MFNRVLIANRGEIAVRIIKACQEMGIKTIAIYSEVDEKAPHVKLADETINLGDPTPIESYLNIPNILSAAEITKADAIHPGYGFLAENPRFSEICQASGMTFIGPPAEVMRTMGDKSRARQEMKRAKLPIIQGSDKIIEDISAAKKVAQRIGLFVC